MGTLSLPKSVSDTSPDELIRLMVGREILKAEASRPFVGDAPCLTVSGLTVKGVLTDINFQVGRGEIVGLPDWSAPDGPNCCKLFLASTGWKGVEISLNGVAVEDSVSKRCNVCRNCVCSRRPKTSWAGAESQHLRRISLSPTCGSWEVSGILRKKKRDQLATLYAERLNLRYRKLSQLALLLSGGNQQKIVLGKWLARNPLVLLLDEPTRGIDVGAKSEIYSLIRELTQRGYVHSSGFLRIDRTAGAESPHHRDARRPAEWRTCGRRDERGIGRSTRHARICTDDVSVILSESRSFAQRMIR